LNWKGGTFGKKAEKAVSGGDKLWVNIERKKKKGRQEKRKT